MTPWKIRKECYLLRRCLVLMLGEHCSLGSQVFLGMVEVWSMHKTDAQCKAGGREGAKGRRSFMIKFFLSCVGT